MASSHNNNNNIKIKIHEHCKVAPPPSTTQTTTIPLTFFDMIWLRYHPVECIFFYTLPNSQSHPPFFFNKVVPNLKASLSLTLQHFPPLAGNIIWPSESQKPIIQYTPAEPDDANNGVSLLIAESDPDDADLNYILENSPHEASLSRSFVPHLESNDSSASVISLQITLFPNNGFSIGISAHHAVFDGKSLIMFIKAWASLCKNNIGVEGESISPTLVSELEPLFNREIIKEPNNIGFIKYMTESLSNPNEKGIKRSLKILSAEPEVPKLEEESVRLRATFQLRPEDLDKIKKRVLAKWQVLLGEEGESKPKTLSTFVVTCAYVLVCIAKAIQGVEKKREKFGFSFNVDCRARLEPPIPNNYFGNCVWGQLVDAQPMDFIKEEGLFLVAKSIHDRIKMINKNGVYEGVEDACVKYATWPSEGVEIMGVAMSNQFGFYEIDFGWGRPAKVEIISVDKGLSIIGLTESRDHGRGGGVEVGLVLNSHVMNLFTTLFHEGLY